MSETAVQTERILTVPNVLSFARLLGVPLFLWLVLGPQADEWAFLVLAVSGVTDYLDGYLARRLGQVSRLGQLLDPLADRLYILAALIGLLLRGIVPWWLVAGLLARDVALTLTLPVLRRRGIPALPVHYLGKAATFNLLYAFPLLLLGDGSGVIAEIAKICGWTFALWGTGLYWWSGILYLEQVRRIVTRIHPTTRSTDPRSTDPRLEDARLPGPRTPDPRREEPPTDAARTDAPGTGTSTDRDPRPRGGPPR